MKELLGDYEAFIRAIDDGLATLGITKDELSMMDHICYRVETTDRYHEMLESMASIGTLLGESMVNGRPIATFELHQYIHVAGWVVPFVELPAPKQGSPYAEGLEHVEFVVVGSLERFLERHSNLPLTRSGMNKLINPEAGLKTEGISVKFHEQQLGAVVRIEKSMEITT